MPSAGFTGYSFRAVATESPEDMEAAIAASDVVELPELAALPDNLRNRSSIERFELGLQTVLDGIERFLDRPVENPSSDSKLACDTAAVLTERVRQWREEGAMEDILGRRLFVWRREGTGPLLLFLHGFPSCSYDWRELLALRPEANALAFDFLGFGLSEKPRDHVYTLAWQADAVDELVRRAGSPPVFVVAHDMGTSVATELMARDLRGELGFDLAGALLFNGSMLLHLASPTFGQKLLRSQLGSVFARLTSERSFRAQFSRVFSDEHPLSAEEAADQWSLLSHNGGRRVAHRTIHYMTERERFTERWHGAIRDWPGALTLAWGLLDPVATVDVLDGLRALRPGLEVFELPDAAHYPQIECPEQIDAALDAAIVAAGEEPSSIGPSSG